MYSYTSWMHSYSFWMQCYSPGARQKDLRFSENSVAWSIRKRFSHWQDAGTNEFGKYLKILQMGALNSKDYCGFLLSWTFKYVPNASLVLPLSLTVILCVMISFVCPCLVHSGPSRKTCFVYLHYSSPPDIALQMTCNNEHSKIESY